MKTRSLLMGFLAVAALYAQPLTRWPENPRYYSYLGKPILLVTGAEHYGAVLNLDFDWRKYLQALEADGMNYTRIFSGVYYEHPGAFGIPNNTLAPKPSRHLGPWMKNDAGKYNLDQFNPAYFERLREFTAEAAKRGVVVEMTFFTSIYGEPQWKLHAFHPANNVNDTGITDFKQVHTLNNGKLLEYQLRLVRKIATELNGFDNVLFEVQNEPWADQGRLAGVVHPGISPPQRDRWPNSVDAPTPESYAWHARIAAEFTAAESRLPKKHLLAMNWSNFRDAIREVPAGIGAVHFHYAWPEAAYWNRHLNMPVGCDETGFMGPEDHVYRRQAWEFLLSGGALYNHLDYSFKAGDEAGQSREPKAPGGGSPELRRQLAALRHWLEATPFPRMEIDLRVVAAAPGMVTHAFSLPGSVYVIYGWGAGLEEMTLMVPPGRWKVEWMDPAVAQPLPPEERRLSGGPLRLKPPAYGQDLALRLTKMP